MPAFVVVKGAFSAIDVNIKSGENGLWAPCRDLSVANVHAASDI